MASGSGDDQATAWSRAPEPPPSRAPGRRWRRWLLRTAIGLGIVVALGLGLAHFAAGLIAKLQLERMGIANQGVTSLRVDLWNSQVDLGTVEFWSADAEPGRIGNVSMTYSLGNLFAGRALIDQMVVEGIDLRISRDAAGAITVNGIALADFLGAEEEQEVEEELEGEEQAAFGVGLDSFLLKDSQMILEIDTGGTLLVEVDRLIIEDMRSWDPDHPAVITMTGRVNDIDIEMEAEAHLFTETIMADTHLRLTSVDIAKLAEFTGPLGFERRAGEVDVRLITSVQIEPNGRVLAAGLASITHDGVDLARPELEYRAEHQRIDVSGVVIASPQATTAEQEPAAAPVLIQGMGQVRLRAERFEAKTPAAGRIAADGLTIVLRDVALIRAPDGRMAVAAKPSIEVEAPRASGPVELTADAFGLALAELRVELDGDSITIAASGSGETAAMQLELPGEAAAATSMTTDGIRVTFEDVTAALTPAGADVEGRLSLESGRIALETPLAAAAAAGLATLAGLGLDVGSLALALTPEGAAVGEPTAAETPEASAEADAIAEITYRGLAVDLADFRVTTIDGLHLGSTGTVEVDAIELSLAEEGPPTTLTLADAHTTFDDVALGLSPNGDTELSGRWRFGATKVDAETPVGDGHATLTVDAVSLELRSLELEASGGSLKLAATGGSELSGIAVTAPATAEQPEAVVTLGQLATTVEGFSASAGPVGIEAGGQLAVKLAELDAETAVEGAPATLVLANYTLTLAEAKVTAGEAGITVAAVGSTELGGLQTSLGEAAGRPAVTLEVGALRQSIDRLTVALGEGAPTWAMAVGLEGEAIAVAIEGEAPGSLRLGRLALTGLEADQELAVSAKSLTLGDLDVELSDRTLAAFAGDDAAGGGATTSTPATGAPAAKGPTLRLGRLTVEPPALARFTDSSVAPPVVVEAELNRLEVANLDTADPNQRTDLELDAKVNQFTDLVVTGWVAAMKEPPDFDLEIEVENLELPALSPHVAKAAGMNLDSGTLSTRTKVAATDGSLDGLIQLEVLDLTLSPVTEEDAKKASATIGLPIGMVVALLEDDEGTITLELPLSGSLEAPDVDISDAVDKAVGGSLEAVFPPTLLANMLTEDGSGFQPITFEAGEAELSDVGREQADAFADLLEGEPKLELLVCGRATAVDSGAPPPSAKPTAAGDEAASPPEEAPPVDDEVSAEMTLLAEERARAVKAYLVEERALPAERVRECRPTYNASDSGSPRVDLSLT